MNKTIIKEYFSSHIDLSKETTHFNPRANSPYEDGWSQQFYRENPIINYEVGSGTMCVTQGIVVTVPLSFFSDVVELFYLSLDEFEELLVEWFQENKPELNVFKIVKDSVLITIGNRHEN